MGKDGSVWSGCGYVQMVLLLLVAAGFGVKTHFSFFLFCCCAVVVVVVIVFGQVLYGLQVFWFSLIVRMAYRIFVKGDILEDIRSGDDEDDGEELHKKEN